MQYSFIMIGLESASPHIHDSCREGIPGFWKTVVRDSAPKSRVSDVRIQQACVGSGECVSNVFCKNIVDIPLC